MALSQTLKDLGTAWLEEELCAIHKALKHRLHEEAVSRGEVLSPQQRKKEGERANTEAQHAEWNLRKARRKG